MAAIKSCMVDGCISTRNLVIPLDESWMAATNRKVAKFVHDYPQLFENIRTLMFQPRSSSVHASALLVTPDEMDGEDVECFDFVPIKKIDDVLVSEML
mgnify:CR=1 FL=1